MDSQRKNLNVRTEYNLNIVLAHGVLSDGSELKKIAEKFLDDYRLREIKVKVSVVKYGKLQLFVGRIPFVRKLVSRYVAARLAVLTYKYPSAKTVIIAHSFGTWAVAHAIKELSDKFRANMLILVGSVVSRKFPWHKHDLQVHNFVGTDDMVVLSSALWGTGWSGVFGFKDPSGCNEQDFGNVNQYVRTWGHSDYPKGYDEYVRIIEKYMVLEINRARMREWFWESGCFKEILGDG